MLLAYAITSRLAKVVFDQLKKRRFVDGSQTHQLCILELRDLFHRSVLSLFDWFGPFTNSISSMRQVLPKYGEHSLDFLDWSAKGQQTLLSLALREPILLPESGQFIGTLRCCLSGRKWLYDPAAVPRYIECTAPLNS